MKQILYLLLLASGSVFGQGSYAPNADSTNSTAMHKDSSAFVLWANNCVVTRGYQNILDPSLGYASVGTNQSGVGIAGDNDVVSLGDGGSAILTFAHEIINGTGPDFAVFENSFNNTFLELAFVEVSSNGIDFVRFPSHSQTSFASQIGGFDDLDATNIYNLAGKYKARFGTPFDLEDLIDSTAVDVNNITHIKIIDVVGIVNANESSYDSQGNQINDPFPTPYPSSGFDLDGVGVIHMFVGVPVFESLGVTLYPNPSNGDFSLSFPNDNQKEISIYNALGEKIETLFTTNQSVSFDALSKGFYFVHVKIGVREQTMKVVVN